MLQPTSNKNDVGNTFYFKDMLDKTIFHLSMGQIGTITRVVVGLNYLEKCVTLPVHVIQCPTVVNTRPQANRRLLCEVLT